MNRLVVFFGKACSRDVQRMSRIGTCSPIYLISCLLDLPRHSILNVKQYSYCGRGVSSKQRMYESAREHFQVKEPYKQGHINT